MPKYRAKVNSIFDEVLEISRNKQIIKTSKLKLGKPANKSKLLKVQKLWGVKIPKNYKNILERFDGIQGLEFPKHFLSTTEVLSTEKTKLNKFINNWKKTEDLNHVHVIGINDTATNWILYYDPKKLINNEMILIEWTPNQSYQYDDINDFFEESIKTWKNIKNSKSSNKKAPQIKNMKVDAITLNNEHIIMMAFDKTEKRKISKWSFNGEWMEDIGEEWPYYTINSLQMSPDNKQVAFARYGAAHVVDLTTGIDLLEKFEFCSQFIGSIAYKPEGNVLVTRYENAIETVWEMKKKDFSTKKMDISALTKSKIYTLNFYQVTTSGHMLFSCNRENVAMVVCNSKFEPIYIIPSNIGIVSISLKNNGEELVRGYKDGVIEVLSLSSGKIKLKFKTNFLPTNLKINDYDNLIRSICFDAKTKKRYFIVWDASGKEIMREQLACGKERRPGNDLVITPDGNHCVAIVNGRVNLM